MVHRGSQTSARRDVGSSNSTVRRALGIGTGHPALARNEVDQRPAGRAAVARHFSSCVVPVTGPSLTY